MLKKLLKSFAPTTVEPSAVDAARAELEHETLTALCSNVLWTGWSDIDAREVDDTYNACQETIQSYSDETLKRIKVAARTNLGRSLLQAVQHTSDDEVFLNDWMSLAPSTAGKDDESRRLILGLSYYENLASQDEPERRCKQVAALLRITSYLNEKEQGVTIFDLRKGWRNNPVHISDKRLSDLIALHENPMVVADVMMAREFTTYEQVAPIIEAMDSGATVLSAGAL